MDVRQTWTERDEAGDYVVPNVLSPRDLVSRPDRMDETVPHTLFSVTAKLISAFVFAKRIVQPLYFINPKFQAPIDIFCGCTARFMSDLVGNPEDRFSHDAAELVSHSERGLRVKDGGRYILKKELYM